MLKPASICLLATLLLALFVSGCGGGGDDKQASAATSLSKAEFVKQGNAICKKASKERVAKFEAHTGDISTEEIVLKYTLPSMQEIGEQLGELGAPKGDEEKIEAIVTGIDEGVEKSEEEIEKDPEGFDIYVAPAEKQAVAYGLKECEGVL
jgi:hypothetical protein